MQQLTTDYNRYHPDMKHLLLRAIGFSDGISGILSDAQLQSLLQHSIIDVALRGGGKMDRFPAAAVDYS